MKEKTYRLYRFNDFQLEVDEGVLKKGTKPVPLTPKAFETLVVLLENRGKVVDKEILLSEVWEDTFVEETTLAQNIFTIRRALGIQENGKQIIETVPKRGYKFVADVTEVVGSAEDIIFERNARSEITAERRSVEDGDAVKVQDEQSFAEKFSPATLNPSFSPFLTSGARRLLPAGFLLVIFALISYGVFSYFQMRNSRTAAAVETPASGIHSIAVLPFQTVGEQDRDEKLGFGMADAIITRLSKLQKIPVRPTSAIVRYVEQSAFNAAEIGRDLGVDAIVEGTIQREGERIRISVQLTSVIDSRTLWAETYDENSAGILALQDSISGKVVRSLALKLTPEQEKLLEQHPTNSPEALAAYQLGVYLWNTRTQENLEKAKGYFQQAVELDPKFARAYGMLADTYHLIAYYSSSDSDELYEKSRFNAMKALALDDSVAEAYMALAGFQLYSKNLDVAESYLESAVERAPYNSTVRVRYAWILLRIGKIDQAVIEMRYAQEYDPLSPVTNGALCNMLTYREDFPAAVRICRKAVELSPNTADNRLSLAYAYFYNGNTEEALKQAKIDLEQGEEKDKALSALAYFYARLGWRAEAEAILARLKPLAENKAVLFADLTLITYTLGRKDEAYLYFRKSCEKKVILPLLFRTDPVWKEIRQDSRFLKLAEESLLSVV
jgi:DNA-binding winged helix-turn-helix (wHTH) protein/TolB-like protein/Flp pilus assembly protein TadD